MEREDPENATAPSPGGSARELEGGLFERMVAIRRDLHRHPELSWQEERTARQVCRELDRLGIAYRAGVAGTGIVADIPGPPDVPKVALRADMDALPIHEATGLPFASTRPGVMHACGHDGHTAMLIGAAELLLAQPSLPAPVRLIFQPAEERGAGAPAMIAEGALDGVGMIFGGHVDRHYPAGALVVTEGCVNASTDGFCIRVRGKDGHGARPHESVDAIVVGSLLVMAIQTIVSREVDPAHPSVISVGRFRAGEAPNVIAGCAELAGTIRAQHPAVRAHLIASLERVARSVGQLHSAEVEVEFVPGAPPLENGPLGVEIARAAARRVVPADSVTKLRTANMGGEDFAFFTEQIPGCYIRYGAQVEGREGFPAHSSRFDFDERAMATGARWLCEVALEAGQRLVGR